MSAGKSRSPTENIQVCKSWLHVTQDITVNNNRKSAFFFQDISNHFNEIMSSDNINYETRSATALSKRWTNIQHASYDVNIFTGCVEKIRTN